MSILKIDSSARLANSNSRVLTQYLTDSLTLSQPQALIERDLVQQPLPAISAEDLIGVHGSAANPTPSMQQQLQLSEQLIGELKAVDTVVFGVPMYNFTVPAALKQWIDYVCRAGVSFSYSKSGPIGLTGVKRAFIVTSSGGTPIGSAMDFASPYLEHICRFLGIEDVIQINASGSKGSPELILAQGKEQIDRALAELTEQDKRGVA